jgi:hypothetical protein
MSNDNDILLWEMIEVRSVSDKTSYASEELPRVVERIKPSTLPTFTFSAIYVGGHTIGPIHIILCRIRDSSCTIPILPTLARRGFARLTNLAMLSGVISTHVIGLPSEPL